MKEWKPEDSEIAHSKCWEKRADIQEFYPDELSFENEGKIKTVSFKERLRESIAHRAMNRCYLRVSEGSKPCTSGRSKLQAVGTYKCKVPKEELHSIFWVCISYLRNSKGTIMVGTEWMIGRVEGDEIRVVVGIPGYSNAGNSR